MTTEPPVQALAALDDRIQRNHRDLVAFLARRVGGEAEELAQETWLRVARAAPECADDEGFRRYAFTVARRLVIDHYRRRAVRSVVVALDGGLERAADRSADPHGRASAAQILQVVERSLGAMKPEVAEVFRRRTTTGASFKEIAADQGVSINTALGRHHHATRQIRKALAAAGLLPGDPP